MTKIYNIIKKLSTVKVNKRTTVYVKQSYFLPLFLVLIRNFMQIFF